MKNYKILVKTNESFYPVVIGKNILINISDILKENKIFFQKCIIIYDSNVPLITLNILKQKLKNKNTFVYKIKSSEKVKNINTVNKILNFTLKHKFHRTDLIISVGGGIVSDIAGFVSSIFKRGINFVNMPTTLLSQVDASIGGKTGVNSTYGKNLIGSFYQPKLVLSDILFLKSLPKRELICGYAEILKHTIIQNKKKFLFLDKNLKKIFDIDEKIISKTIYESCKIKKSIIEKDPLERNLRKILNYGHTFGHAFEASFNYSKKLNHGEAVLLGMYCANNFAYRKNIINESDFNTIEKHFAKFDLSNKLKKILKRNNLSRIINYMKSDKKNYNNKINLILLNKIGSAKINNTYKTMEIETFFRNLLINR